jgi:transposase InsO family protein
MCRVLKVSRSGYYEWKDRPESARASANKRLLERIKTVHKESRETYGVARVHGQLIAEGESCDRKRVARLMKDSNIRSKRRKKYKATTDSKHNHPVAENLLDRNFSVDAPDRVWVSDITYIPTEEGWLYLAAVKDLFQKKIVGWSMSAWITKELAIGALEMAISHRQPQAGLIHHSDRGSQYASGDYQKKLLEHGMLCSMSKKGDPWDNAPMESFFGTLKMELVHHRKYQSRAEAKADIFEYIEVFYNRIRLQTALGMKSPEAYEAAYCAQAAQTAA